MCRLLDMYSPKLSIIFCNTKRQVDELVQALQEEVILQKAFMVI